MKYQPNLRPKKVNSTQSPMFRSANPIKLYKILHYIVFFHLFLKTQLQALLHIF